MAVEPAQQIPASIELGPDAAAIRCSGAWTVRGIAGLERHLPDISWPPEQELTLDGSAISALDTAGAWLLHRTIHMLEQQGRSVALGGLRPEFEALLKLITARTTLEPAVPPKTGFLASIGHWAWDGMRGLYDMLAFTGESATVLFRSLMHPSRIQIGRAHV